MLQYAEDAQAVVAGRSEDEMLSDLPFRYALQYCLLVVGEAASEVSDATQEKLPNVPWRQIIGMRNWLVHGYSVIRTETLWETATRDLPALVEEIMNYLPPEHT